MNGCVIPHTPIAVDCWQRRLVHAKICFLTHMHTDHTQGLTSSWDQPIYCSEITRSLAIEHLNIKPCFLISIPVGQSTIIPLDDAGVETMTVTLIDANHCAGAVMLLFQGYFGCILHTGDFRYFNGMLDVPPFTKNIVINTLYLDNTYCDPRCEFPSRAEAIKKILNIIHDNRGKEVRIGLDKLGKEELLFEIAKDQGVPIFVEEKLRLEVAELLGHSGFFTRSQEDTYIKVFSRRSVNRRALMDLNRNVRPTIGILPSALYIGRTNPFEESDEIFVVPYSDHSSFSELKAFVAKLRPERIIPVVRKSGRKDEDLPDRSDMTIFANEMSSNAGPHIFDIPPTVREFMSGSSNNRNTPSLKRKASISYFNSRSKRPCGIVFSPEKQTAACVETDKVAVQEEANTSNQPHEDKDVVNQHHLPVDEASKMLQEERAPFDEEMSAKSLGDNEVDRSPGTPKQGKFSESQNLKLSGTPSKRVLQLKQSIIEHIQRMVESPSAVAVNPKEPRENASAVELPKDTEISFNKRNTDEINILPQSGNELHQKRDDDLPNLPEIEANKKLELPVNLDQPSEMQSELSSTEHTEALSDPNFTSCGSQTTSNDPETCDPLATVPRNSSIELGRHSEGIVENTSISKKTSNQCNPLEADVSVSESEKVFEPQANEAENILGKSEPQLVQQGVQSDVCNSPIGNGAQTKNGGSEMVSLDQPSEMQRELSSTEHTEALNDSNFTSCGSQTTSNGPETRDPLATVRRNSSIELGHSEGIVENTSISTKTSNECNPLEGDVSVSKSEKVVEPQANEAENILEKSEPQLVQQDVQSDVCNSPIGNDARTENGESKMVSLDQPNEMQRELSSTEHTEALNDSNFTLSGSQTTSNNPPETRDPLATVRRNSSIERISELGHSEGIVENTSISTKTSNQCNPLEADVSVSKSEKVVEPQANEAENILGKSEPQLVQQDVQSDVCNPPIGNDARNENGESKMVNLDQPGEMQSELSSTEHTELLNNSNFTSCGSQTRSNDSETRDPLATMRRNSSIELGRHSEGIVEDTSISTKTSNQYNLLEADVSVSESEKIVEFQANEPENILGKSEPQLVQQGVQSDVCNSPINEHSKMAAGDFQFPDNSSPVVHSKPDDLTRDTVEHQSQPGLQDSLKALTNGKIGVAKTNRKNDLPLNEICSAQKLDKAASNGDYLKVSQKVDSLNAEQRKQHNLDDVFSSEEAKQQTLNDSLTEVFASRGEKSTEKSEGLGIRIAEEEKLHTLNDNTTQVLGEQTVTLNKEVSREQKANESLTWHDLKGLPADEKRKLETLNELNRAQVCEPENNKNGEQCKLNMVSGTRDFSSRSEDNVTNEEELAVPVPEANMQLILRVLDSQEGAKTSIRVLEEDDIGLATLDRFCNVKDSEGCDSKDIDVYLRILNKTGRPLGIEVDSTEQLVGNLTSSGSTQVHCLTSQALQETAAELVQRQPISNPAPNSRKKRRKLTGIYREILSRKPTRTRDNYPK
ncbi:uncharacterized protein LOC114533064 [Dendronephthya gigantea]|uniref:uncharacterized protein LOC114533064 n=1 Tax=Dendronephthya gigantea TaxID=151771 RepID=UPI00106B6C95|nr:uncharacterized protein LOC114533064 [Dendronephthya gigantea]